MATEAEALFVKIEARVTDAERALARFQRQADGHMKSVQRAADATRKKLETSFNAQIGAGMVKGFAAVKAGIAAVVGSAAIGALTQLMDELGKINDVADAAGISTKAVQELTFAVEQSGGTAEEAAGGILKFAKNLALARTGQGALAADLKANGIGVTGNTLDMLEKVIGLISRAKNEQDALLIAERAFGRASADSWALAAKSVDEFNKMRAKASTMDDAVVRQGADLGDRFAAAAKEIRNNLAPAMTDLMQQITESAEKWANFSKVVKEVYAFAKANAPATMTFGEKQLAMADLGIKDAERKLAIVRAQYDKETSEGVVVGKASNIFAAEIANLESLIAKYQAARSKWLAALGRPEAGPSMAPGTVPEIAGQDWAFHGPRSGEFPSTKPAVVTDGSGGGGKSAAQVQAETTAKVIENLKFEGEQLARTAEQQRIYNELKSAGVERTSAQGQEIERLVKANYALEQSQAKLKESQAQVNEAMQGFANVATSAFDSLIVQGESLNDVVSNTLKNLASLLLQAALSGGGPFAGAMGLAGVGGAPGGLIGALLAGARAGGGPVARGRPYLVGEKGPEIVVPKMAGHVISNDRLKAVSGGGQAINVNVVNNLSADGADPQQLMRLQMAFAASEADMPRKMKMAISQVQSRRVR